MDDRTKPELSLKTLAAQPPGADELITGAVTQPIHMSATYLRDPDNRYPTSHVYGRSDNVSMQQGEALIAAMEGADEALLFDAAHDTKWRRALAKLNVDPLLLSDAAGHA